MKNKILSLLVLLLTAATGAWAEDHEYVDLGLPSGTLWATCNVGADSPEQYGGYFAFGEVETKSSYSPNNYKWASNPHEASTFTKYNHVDNLTVLQPEDDAATVNWGVQWRMPTVAEVEELIANCEITSTTLNNKTGYLYTSKINGKTIFFPHAGYYDDNDLNFYGAGQRAYLWTASVYENLGGMMFYNWYSIDGYCTKPASAGCGMTVRPVFNKYAVPVTTNVEEGDTCFTEAWFNMPAYDATVTYELVRDMEYKVNAYVGDDAEVTYRHRVEKVSDNLYKPVNITDDAQIIALFNVIDTIDAASPKPLVYGTDFTVTIVDEDQNETVPAEFNFAPGIYTVKVTGIGDYDGLIDSRNQFKLYYGYELKVAPGNYATYYKDEPLTTADENAELYTIASINGSKAVLSEQMQSVPKNTPFLIYNNHQTDTVTFVLFPVEGGQLSLIQYAPEFKGTLNDSIMPASSEGTKYYICNGYDFVWVRNAGTIAANRCWLEISNSNARALNIVFGDEATSIKNLTPTLSEGEGAWYDLNGRKLNGMPTRKGVYILNGKKTVIK